MESDSLIIDTNVLQPRSFSSMVIAANRDLSNYQDSLKREKSEKLNDRSTNVLDYIINK